MRLRRVFLGVATVALMSTGIERYSHAVPTEVEVDGYGGSTAGQWTCGPSARAQYAGVGGGVRVHPLGDDRPPSGAESAKRASTTRVTSAPGDEIPAGDPPGEIAEQPPAPVASPAPPRASAEAWEATGLELGGFAAGERRGYKLTACNDTPCGSTDVVPPSNFLGAGRVELGYDGRWIGIRAGAMVFPRWAVQTDSNTTVYALPTVDLRVGRRSVVWGSIGFGAWDSSTLFRPGAYLGLGFGDPRSLSAEFHLGANLVFDDEIGGRVDGRIRYALTDLVGVGLGVAGQGGSRLLPEGTAFLVFTP